MLGATLQKLTLISLMTAVWLFVFAVNNIAVSQQVDEPLFPIWDEHGKEGFIDVRGKTIIAPQFDGLTSFSEGLAAVRVGDKWGYIDRTGKVIVTPRWKVVSGFSSGVAAVVDSTHGYSYSPLEGDGFSTTLIACGYIDKTGRYLIEPNIDRKMTSCQDFIDGIVPVCFEGILKLWFPDFVNAGKCGFMDKSGKWAIEPQLGKASYFSEGLSLIRRDPYYDKEANAWLNDFVYIDKSGKTVIELKGYYLATSFENGLAQAIKNIGTIRFIDSGGNLKFEVKATSIGPFRDGLAMARDSKTNRYGFIDLKGTWVIPPKYYAGEPFSEGVALMCGEHNICNYIDTSDRVVRDGASGHFREGLTLAYLYTRTIHETPNSRNIYGYKNMAGKFVWVSPGGSLFLNEKWWRENYIGPTMPTSFRLP